jgi:hypothetical protein
MPTRPKSIQPPWITKIDYATPGQGRRVINPFYQSVTWKKVRLSHIKAEPLCRECKAMGLTVSGSVVDHIKQINPVDVWDMQGETYGHPIDESNLQTLCTMHHNMKSGRERHGKK